MEEGDLIGRKKGCCLLVSERRIPTFNLENWTFLAIYVIKGARDSGFLGTGWSHKETSGCLNFQDQSERLL